MTTHPWSTVSLFAYFLSIASPIPLSAPWGWVTADPLTPVFPTPTSICTKISTCPVNDFCEAVDGSAGKESACNAGGTGDMGRYLDWDNSLEKEMAAHSSTLAWKIPWTEEPGELQSMGSQRVGYDWATKTYHLYMESKIWHKWTYPWNRNRFTA